MSRYLMPFSVLAALLFGGLMSAANAYSGEAFVTCNLDPNGDNFLAMRTCGSSKCDIVKKLDPDTFLLTYEPHSTNNWREVMVLKGLQDNSFSGESGWVYDKYICQVNYLWKD